MSDVVGDELVAGGERVRQEESAVDRIRRVWIYGISAKDEDDDNERVDPCVPKREGFPSPEDRLRFPSFGGRAGGVCLRVALKRKVSPAVRDSDTAWCVLGLKEEC